MAHGTPAAADHWLELTANGRSVVVDQSIAVGFSVYATMLEDMGPEAEPGAYRHALPLSKSGAAEDQDAALDVVASLKNGTADAVKAQLKACKTPGGLCVLMNLADELGNTVLFDLCEDTVIETVTDCLQLLADGSRSSETSSRTGELLAVLTDSQLKFEAAQNHLDV